VQRGAAPWAQTPPRYMHGHNTRERSMSASQKDKIDPAAKRAGTSDTAHSKNAPPDDAIVIKKYANRRLYNTGTSSYVTLDYLSEMVKNGENFVVYDAKSGEDITRSVLTQIIFEEENKGQNLLPVQFLRQLIQFYGDSLQSFVPSYLEMSMDTFSKNQEKIRDRMRETFGATPGYSFIEETTRQNMALIDNAMKMFTPPGMREFYAAATGQAANVRGQSDHQATEVAMLKAEISELKRQLAETQGTAD